MANPNQPPNGNQTPRPGGDLPDAEELRPPMQERVPIAPERVARLGGRVLGMPVSGSHQSPVEHKKTWPG